MIKMNNKYSEQISKIIIRSAIAQTLKKAIFSKASERSIVSATATLRLIGGRVAIQTEFLHRDNKATHENTYPDSETALEYFAALSNRFGQVNVITTVGDCEYRRSSKGKEILLRGDKLLHALECGDCEKAEISENNRKKAYILVGNEPFLIKLGISDKNGRPYDKRLPKLRQINRFLEYVRDIEKKLSSDGVLRICDLCCGKSYLSFAVYHYFANILGREVEMTGVDLKPDVMAYCETVAKELGFVGLHFICGDVAKYTPKELPELVVSLHACDTATDIVLNKASEWRSKAILSTPCCHHEMNHKLNCPTLSFIAEHSMLRQKFCDAATDALRLKKLKAEGYCVEAVELVDPDDTPKNILLRAVLNGNENDKAKAEYEAIYSFLYGDKI